ncbi:MAG: substrate-binding domain-containing protein [Pseudonocardiales bacterium]|nr:substrate-binding domain-containing protein [Pseudonocardiales bacterium]
MSATSPRTFARNKLEIAVAPGNPKGITGLADLARPGLKVTLEDASVLAGRYSREALSKAGATVKPVSNPLDVKSALLTVTSGEADATIVYVTDVATAAGKAPGVAIPDTQNVVTTYPIAVVKAGRNQVATLRDTFRVLTHPPGEDLFRSRWRVESWRGDRDQR